MARNNDDEIKLPGDCSNCGEEMEYTADGPHPTAGQFTVHAETGDALCKGDRSE